MLRYKMIKLIRLLESHPFSEIRDTVLAPTNEKALKALIDLGCVEATRAWGGEIVSVRLLDHSAVYRLERSEVWLNRIYGFIAGVITTAAGELIAYAIRGLLSK